MNALFLVSSPFQCLCAFEAIQHYRISNPTFEINSHLNNERNNQIETLLKDKGYAYSFSTTVHITRLSLSHMLRFFGIYIRPILFRIEKYDIIFLGDYIYGCLDLLLHHYEIKKGGKIIYLDDGASTIRILSGNYIPTAAEIKIHNQIDLLCQKNKISNNNFFTIFKDVVSHEFKCDINTMSTLATGTIHADSDIYIIGTNIEKYCKYLGVDKNSFVSSLNDLLHLLGQTCKCNVVYIPHGRERLEVVEQICKQNGVKYKRLETCVEHYFYSNKIYPKTIIGFTSTALYSLKILFPNSVVLNVFYGGSFPNAVASYEEISESYRIHGIKYVRNLSDVQTGLSLS